MRTAADLPDTIRQLVIDGRDAWYAQDYVRARGLFEEVLTLSEAAEDRFGQAAAYHFLGNVAFNECRDRDSRMLHTRALDLSRRDCDHQGVATSLGSIAHIDVAEGDFEAAQRTYDAAVREYELANMPDEAQSLRQRSNDLLERRVRIEDVVHRAEPSASPP
jgi:tetratricopeptide (TPR) repeat protein